MKTFYKKIGTGATTLFVAGIASAQTVAPDLNSILSGLAANIVNGMGVTIDKIGPVLALAFGLGYAWRWIKKGSKG
jgi:hypothetical protein